MRQKPIKIFIARAAEKPSIFTEQQRDFYSELLDGFGRGMIIEKFINSEPYRDGWREDFDMYNYDEAEGGPESEESVNLPPYDLGFWAFCNYYHREDNPFVQGSGQHNSWDQGWCDAQQEEIALRLIRLARSCCRAVYYDGNVKLYEPDLTDTITVPTADWQKAQAAAAREEA